ncbi:MAG: MurR/RpiR family transcriptional regulator [Solirubrobacterales bacterium]|nr:MurR/RpiR family transcriptional regulator [Solirubrobacterales bacterium]
MGGGEGEPDRAAAAEEVRRVRGGLVVPQHLQRRLRRRDRRGSQRQVEGDHVAVGEAQRPLERHRNVHPIRSDRATASVRTYPGRERTPGCGLAGVAEGKARGPAKWTAVTKAATKAPPQLKSLSEYIQGRFGEFSRSQKDVARYIVDHLDEAAFLTAEELAGRASTSSSTVVRFSQALGFEGYPELQQAAIEEYRSSTVTGNGAASGEALFSFDHSELEGSLGADHANLEETARNLTREQVDGAVAALAGAQRIVIVGVDQMAFFASYLRHTLSLLDIRAEIVASTGGESLQRLGRIDEETLVIVLSSGRAHPLLLRAMKLALHRNASTLAISDASMSEVGEHAGQTLYFSSNSPSFARSNTALMALVQALAHGLYARDEAAHKDRIRAYKLK